MKIAILTSGILPVPAVKGGAVENLIDFYLQYNDEHKLHDITVYSIADEAAYHHPALQSKVNHYVFIDTNNILAKIRKKLFCYLHFDDSQYYHYSIEYYLHQAIKYIRQNHYDVIILENRPAYALKLKKETQAKLVYHLHNRKLDNSTLSYQEIYDAASKILTVSDFIKSQVTTINPNDTKAITIHNGIDLTAFRRRSNKSRETIGIKNDDFLLVFSGRINKEKGMIQLIEAMLRLKDKAQIKLMVIGSSFYGNATSEDEFIKDLKTKAQALKDRIIFTGFIPYSQIPDYLSMADVAVIPSVWDDPFPTTVLEAQAIGLPIITTHRGGIPEEVTDKNAILLDTDEHFIDNLTSAILDLYEHTEKRQQMAMASLEHAKLFDKETYAKNVFKVIAEV